MHTHIRTLYDCLHAKYPSNGLYITCSKGHKLGNGNIHKDKVLKGDKLICRACSLCTDFSDMNDLTFGKISSTMEVI